jgi:hypothetical protein
VDESLVENLQQRQLIRGSHRAAEKINLRTVLLQWTEKQGIASRGSRRIEEIMGVIVKAKIPTGDSDRNKKNAFLVFSTGAKQSWTESTSPKQKDSMDSRTHGYFMDSKMVTLIRAAQRETRKMLNRNKDWARLLLSDSRQQTNETSKAPTGVTKETKK